MKRMLPHYSFTLETETFVQTNHGFIVGVNFELDAQEIEPLISEIDTRPHQFLANAFTLHASETLIRFCRRGDDAAG